MSFCLRFDSHTFLRNCLRRGDGLADLTAALPGVQSALDTLGGLLDDLGTLGEDELDVGGVGHVRVDLRAVRGEISASGLLVRTRPWAW